MKSVKINGFKYTSGLGEMIFDQVMIAVPDEWSDDGDYTAADYGIFSTEILKMERALALAFFKRSYRLILLRQRTITPTELKGIQDVLGVNRMELGQLLGLNKASVTALFKGKAMNPSLANLIMERLGMELGRPGSAKALLNGGNIPSDEESVAREICKARYASCDWL